MSKTTAAAVEFANGHGLAVTVINDGGEIDRTARIVMGATVVYISGDRDDAGAETSYVWTAYDRINDEAGDRGEPFATGGDTPAGDFADDLSHRLWHFYRAVAA